MNSSSPLLSSRREFLRQACCAGVSASGVLTTLTQLQVLGAVATPTTAAATPSDYKALVCIYLAGGNDGANTIIPIDATSYADYTRARVEVAIPQALILPITPRSYRDGRSYGLHPNLGGLQSLFNQGKAAIVGNVGTLLQPTTLSQYQAGTALPIQLFSHTDQSVQWQSSISDRPFETGWGGRLADLVNAMNENPRISMSLTMGLMNNFQIGRTVAQFAVGADGVPTISPGGGIVFNPRRQAITTGFSTPQANLLAEAFNATAAVTLRDGDIINAAMRSAPTLRTPIPPTPTARNLAAVARLISVASTFNLRRQIFYLLLPGFDTHGLQAQYHDPLMTELGDALKAFYDATVELGVAEQVTTFTASDFGRTYNANFGGTDHGWGNQQFVVGGAVKGGEIYGRMPSLVVGGSDDTGRGRWIPSTSVDEYSATLATWFGVSATNLPLVLPNIGRFPQSNLGFL